MNVGNLKRRPLFYSALGLAFAAAAAGVGSAFWTQAAFEPSVGTLSLADNFICSTDTRNKAREPEYVALAAALGHAADSIRSRFLNGGNRDAMRTILQAQRPNRLTENPDTGALTALWGRDNPDNPGHLILDRVDGPAYLQIDLAAGTYTELWMRNGIFSREGKPSSIEVMADGVTQQWLKGNDLDNPMGPAVLTLSAAARMLELSWFQNGTPAFIGGRPTLVQMDLSTHIVFHEEYAAGGGPDRRQIHRPADHLNILDRDRRTGAPVYALHMYHDSDPRSDETTQEIQFDAKTGLVLDEIWKKNGLTIARPPVLSHYIAAPAQ